jgi:hypothetical protein
LLRPQLKFRLLSDAHDSPAVLVLVINLPNGLLDEVVKGDIVLPAPVVLGVLVTERARPCLSDCLSEVGRILNLEVRDAPMKERIGEIRDLYSTF